MEGLWRSQASQGQGGLEAVGVPGMGGGKPQGASGNLWGQEKEVGSRAAMRPGGHREALGRHKRYGAVPEESPKGQPAGIVVVGQVTGSNLNRGSLD